MEDGQRYTDNRMEEAARRRILILDGAMGTMVQSYNLKEEDFRGTRFQDTPGQMKGNNDILCLTRPDIVEDIHRRYFKAGADIVETNTFSAQVVSQADYHCESTVKELNLAAARIARKLADEFTALTPDKPRFVAGSIGPTNKTCSISPDVNDPAARAITFDELAAAYKEQMLALLEGGVDAFLIETIFDTLNAKAAAVAAMDAMEEAGRRVPLMFSVTVSDSSGRTLSGQTMDAFLASILPYRPFSVGLNCSLGALALMPYVRHMAQEAPCHISVYPNAGLPNAFGEYEDTPSQMGEEIREYIKEGIVNIIGGCCGTTDEFIARFAQEAEGKTPHTPAPAPLYTRLSGLEMLEMSPEKRFVNIGERCNVAGSRKFLRLIKEKKYDEALSIARKQVEDGALVIDVNMDDGLLEGVEEMTHFLNLVATEPDVCKVPVMIDSSKWDVITAGLKCLQGKCIVNSISLKEGEEKFLSHAQDVMRYGAATIVMAFDEKGQADTFERRIEICSRAYHLLVDRLHFNPLDIIFDPNVLAIATGMEEHNNYAVDFIKTVEWIKANLPGAHISGGISNLSFSFRGNNYIREAMHAVFLYYAIAKGMDMGIVNPATKVTYDDIHKDLLKEIEDVVLNRAKDAADVLIETARKMKEEAEAAKNGGKPQTAVHEDAWRKESLEERLKHALAKGVGDYMEEDLKEALEKYPTALSIIEGPLMAGMNYVGDLFGAGKMFLPQVVKTARTMKKAVAILQPVIESQKKEGASKAGKIVMATVKGDVHDIGKNIVSVVMACNNYEVIDLGVMVPVETIIETVKREHADMIGMSGLITPSLDEMVHNVEAFNKAGIDIPVMIGGATTSKLHTALKIAPKYHGTAIYVKDASVNTGIAAKLMNPALRPAFERELKEEYARLREKYLQEKNGSDTPVATLEEARKKRLELF